MQSQAAKISNSFVVATSFPVGTTERIAIDKSYIEVMRILLILALAFLVIPVLLVLVIENLDLAQIDRERNCASKANIIWYKPDRAAVSVLETQQNE